MSIIYNSALKANVILDDAGQIRGINHLDEYPEIENRRGFEAAIAYVRNISTSLNITPNRLRNLEQRVSYFNPQLQDVEYRFSEEKGSLDSATYSFYQTYLNTPVWAAGITTTLKQAPWRVISATDTSEEKIDAEMPSDEALDRYRRLFATGEKAEDPRSQTIVYRTEASNISGSDLLTDILGQAISNSTGIVDDRQTSPRLIRGRFFVYRYDPDKRIDDHAHPRPDPQVPRIAANQEFEQPVCGTPPTLQLPPVPSEIREGRWYVVAELVFRLPYEGSRMNWRMLVEVETNTILYLRALSSGVNGLVFTYDPITSTGTATNIPNQSNAVLNPHRDDVVLPNLNPPVAGIQPLVGTYANVTNVSSPNISAPSQSVGNDFDYNVRTDEFAAVNAYYHVDRFFRLVADLGFSIASYFDGTSFPIEVDHRGLGNAINANCVGDGDGIDYTNYALADTTDTTNPIGIATDWRVVLHELGGHGILYDHVGTANFGFAHSAGDSFAVILNDYLSEWHNGATIDRFLLAPFVPAVPRRSDRTVADGWGWGGANDVGGYSSEQILSTTMFRVYRSIGGDSNSINRREFAARCVSYLMLRAVGTLAPMSNPGTPALFLAALLTADAGNWTSEGIFGDAYGKVLTWAFEKQNLNGGAPPSIDVYIDDGRAGEYEYLPVHWATTTIWNRRNSDGMTSHEEPALGATNYAYVKIKNRGTSIANNVIVKGYHCKPSAGVLWPNDLQPMTTPQLSAGTLQPNNAEEKIVGPFEWTPVVNAWGHDCMMMIVSADGDPSNVDKFIAGEVVEDWRLVPNDNNVGQRNVTLLPGGGGLRGLVTGLQGKGFWVGNPGRATATIKAAIELPPLLANRGWRISLRGLPADGIRLKTREERLVTFDVHAGTPFTKEDAMATTNRDIIVTATANGAIIGGMVYRIEPDLEIPFNDRPPQDKQEACRDKAEQLLDCLNIPDSKVKRVRVRKIAIDVEMEGDNCC
jgi:zinc metalloprotease ZmpB